MEYSSKKERCYTLRGSRKKVMCYTLGERRVYIINVKFIIFLRLKFSFLIISKLWCNIIILHPHKLLFLDLVLKLPLIVLI